MMKLWVVIICIITHFIADFVFQTDWEAKNKSVNNKALLSHTRKYALLWFPPAFLIFYFNGFNLIGAFVFAAFFCLITFVCHTITDYFTSKLNTRLWNEGRVHEFFVSIGADQVYHYLQIFLTFYYLLT